MNLSLTTEQKLLQETFEKLFARESSAQRVRAAQATGFDAELWRKTVDSGVAMLRVPEAAGGLDASLLEAALVCSEAGRRVVHAPVIETIVAARVLSTVRSSLALEWLERLIRAKAVVSIALVPGAGSQMISYGGVADAVICFEDEGACLIVRRDASSKTAGSPFAMARWDLSDDSAVERHVLCYGPEACGLAAGAVEEWRLLASASLAGLAAEALRMASEYARERTQFGRPVGSFQGLAHPLADAATDVEAARLLVWRTLWSLQAGRADAGALIPLTWWWTEKTAAAALRHSIRAFGGYGLSTEYDIHLYHRAGTAMALLGGGPARMLDQAGERLFASATPSLPTAGETGLEFDLGARAQEASARARRFFETHYTAQVAKKAHHSTSSHDKQFHERLAAARIIFADWPEAVGGVGQGPAEVLATMQIFEEYRYTTHLWSTTDIVGRMVLQFGTPEAKAEILPRITEGKAVCSLGFSEPGAGSDVFSARTSAERDGGDWLINGQKMFTTGGHLADYVLVLARTDSAAAKHLGLTLFVVPTTLQGFSFQAVHTYQDERTNITFFEQVRLPDRYRLGPVDAGGSVMAAALALEHGGGSLFLGYEALITAARCWAESAGARGKPLQDPAVRAALAALIARYEAAAAMVAQVLCPQADGPPLRARGPMTKLFVTEGYLSTAWELLQLIGADALQGKDPLLAQIELHHRRAYGTTIYGGTSEIHRSLVAEQLLNLPRSRS